jgi:hypothetical protein
LVGPRSGAVAQLSRIAEYFGSPRLVRSRSGDIAQPSRIAEYPGRSIRASASSFYSVVRTIDFNGWHGDVLADSALDPQAAAPRASVASCHQPAMGGRRRDGAPRALDPRLAGPGRDVTGAAGSTRRHASVDPFEARAGLPRGLASPSVGRAHRSPALVAWQRPAPNCRLTTLPPIARGTEDIRLYDLAARGDLRGRA